MVEKSLDSVKTYLDTEHGIVLNNPAFTEYVLNYGEISTYPAGYKENAGIFAHNNPWIIIGETVLGRGDRAWEYYEKICPAYVEEKDQTLHKVEPYVYSQMTAGKDAYKPGEAKNSWLTGTAAWNWLTVSQYIVGIRPDFNSLIVEPSLPSHIKTLSVTRKWRDALYEIHIENRGSETVKVTVDGKELEGNRIPYTPGHHILKVIS